MTPTESVFALAPNELALSVSAIVERLMALSPPDKGEPNAWTAQQPPTVSASDYFRRIVKFLPLSNDAIVLTLLYIRRISLNAANMGHCTCASARYLKKTKHKPPGRLNGWNVHRLLFACAVLASKFVCDSFLPQERIIKVGGINSRQESLGLELEALIQLRFRLLWQRDELAFVLKALNVVGQFPEQFDPNAFLAQNFHRCLPHDLETPPEDDSIPIAQLSVLQLDSPLKKRRARAGSDDTVTLTPKLKSLPIDY